MAELWRPVADGSYGATNRVIVSGNGTRIQVAHGGVDPLSDVLADNIRLCERVPAEPQRLGRTLGGDPVAPQPDWSSAPEWAQWWAVDADGEAVFWEHEPEIWTPASVWYHPGECETVGEIEIPLGVDWRQTLQQRPQKKEQAE